MQGYDSSGPPRLRVFLPKEIKPARNAINLSQQLLITFCLDIGLKTSCTHDADSAYKLADNSFIRRTSSVFSKTDENRKRREHESRGTVRTKRFGPNTDNPNTSSLLITVEVENQRVPVAEK